MDGELGRVEQAMKEYFGVDRRRIDHALKVAGFAEKILAHEPGDREVVMTTAFLHDIGIREAERKYGSSAGDLQESEGPPVARDILASLGYEKPFISEVCGIIGSHHSPGEVDTDNFRIIWDADWLVNIPDEVGLVDENRLREMIGKVFQTKTGRNIAERIFLGKG
jgi:hypothetical protein